MIEKDLRKSLRKIGITDDAIRTQEIGDYWRQRGKEFLIGKQLDIRLTDFVQSIRGELSPCASENSNIRICQCIGNKVRLKH